MIYIASNKKPEYFVGVEDYNGRFCGVWFFESLAKAEEFCDKVDNYSEKLFFIGGGPESVGKVASVDKALEELKDYVE